MIHSMIMVYGISDLGPFNDKQYKYMSDTTKEKIDEIKNKIFKEAEMKTKDILSSNKDLI